MPIATSHRGKLCNVTYLRRKSQGNFLEIPTMLRSKIKGRFRTGKDVWRGSENTNRKYSQRIGRNGFCGLWIFCQFPAHSGRFFTFLGHYFSGTKKKEEQTAEMVKESAISEWVAFFWDTGDNDGG